MSRPLPHREGTAARAAAATSATAADLASPAYWHTPAAELLARLRTSPAGLSSAEARARAGGRRAADRLTGASSARRAARILLAQFKSPITLVLIGAALLSFALGARVDALVILAMVAISAALGFAQEHGAADAVARLLAQIRLTARTRRDGAAQEIPVEAVVPGDVVELRAGDVIPADGVLLEARDLFADEAAITGESFPADKTPGVVPADAPLAQRANCLFMGTHVVSGTALLLAVHTGARTEFGAISARLRDRPAAETEFELGIRRLGSLLLEVTLMLVIAIFAFNVYLARPVLESFLFAVALAVGLTPQLLPVVISVNLAHGARRMAARRVIVKRLASIENLGSMDVLCTDKTGTLTEGVVAVEHALDARGDESRAAMRCAYLNAAHETGFANPIDTAIRARGAPAGEDPAALSRWRKLDEVPYDFARKRLSVLLADGEGADAPCELLTKGAFGAVLAACTEAELADGTVVPLDAVRAELSARYEALGAAGRRVLGVARKRLPHGVRAIDKAGEAAMTLVGLLVLADPPKADAAAAVRAIDACGVALKVITGDNRLVAASVARALGMPVRRVVTGAELDHTTDTALGRLAPRTEVFAELEPRHKERIVAALRRAGHVVGYLGDGINDAPALHAADVGVSVDDAVDVAKDAADIVLLEKDLGVLADGIAEGRRTFANTLKYVFMATSANFGNMFSMAGVSLVLPFLPLLPTQVLLTNLLTDLPEMTIAADQVDAELVARPRRWDMRFIRRFMTVFGLVSSVFDFATFAVLARVLRAGEAQFRTGWLVESVVSASVIVLVVRTRRAFVRSRPSRELLAATLAVVGLVMFLPFTALGRLFGLVPLPLGMLAWVGAIVAAYVLTAELAKRVFYRYVAQ